MGLPINTSADISNFDYSVNYNYHTRQITINDLSTYIGGGAALVQGINFLITSPSGITLASNTSYAPADIEPSAPLPFVKNMAFFNSGVEPGTYTIVGTIKDAAGLTFSLTKTTSLCKPKQCPPLSATNGCVNVSWRVFCADNKIIVADNTEFSLTVNGVALQGTPTYDITLINPSNVILAQNVTSPYFEISPVVNGTYSLSIDDSAIYDAGDNVTVTVHYVLENAKKEAQCNINLCEVYCAVNEMYESWTTLKGNGSNTEKTLKSKLDQLALLIGLTQVAINCGNDVTELLTQIEKLSGAKCSCECGTQTVNSGAGIDPDQTIVFQTNGGDITISQQTVGLTTTFTVSDKTYVIAIAAGISSAMLSVATVTVGDTTTFTITAVKVGGILDAQMTATASANSAVESTVYTYAIPTVTGVDVPINTWSKDGDLIRWTVILQNLLVSAANLRTVNFYLNATLVYTFAFNTAALDLITIEIDIVRITSTTQLITVKTYKGLTNGTAVVVYLGYFSGAFTLTNPVVFYTKSLLATAVAGALSFIRHTVELTKKNP